MPLDSLDRSAAVGPDGVSYARFVAGLSSAHYRVVWRDIACGYAALAGGLALAVALQGRVSLPVGIVLAVASSILIGGAIAFLQLFFHEAAHYNLARRKKTNDLLANLVLGALVGQDIRAYRKVHLAHHEHLGTTGDTERTYRNALNWRFAAEALTGIHLARVMIGRERGSDGTARPDAQPSKGPSDKPSQKMLLLGLLLNAAVILGLLFTGYWIAALAWVLAMLSVFPFLASIRQLLEHRWPSADSDRDDVPMAHTRMFDDGWLACVLGGAGFNRHLLHHWAPQVSYTRLPELESFLATTTIRTTIDERRTTYGRALRELWNR
jgi:fatty acid desaturase